ncbi:MAG TPA: hypothetical protein VLK29_12650 [Luteimonas sp.]|nr:hypothetical protein [Luteimonas sp.]
MTHVDTCAPAAGADRVDPDVLLATLAALPTAALFAELDAIVQAMDTGDPRRRARRAGWLGRLLGRDLVAEATASGAASRIGVHLARAAEAAEDLHARLPGCAMAVAALATQARALRAADAPAPARPMGDPAGPPAPGDRGDAGRSTADHRARAIADGTLLAAVQADAMLVHARTLLDRHRQLRDELLPLWQRNQAALAIDARLRSEDGRALVALHAAMRGQLAAWRRPSSTPPTPEPPDPPTKDPLP